MARQIGKMLNAREPKIVNGPQILDKYVGESEANIRRLFADAEEEEKRVCFSQMLEQIFCFSFYFYKSYLDTKLYCLPIMLIYYKLLFLSYHSFQNKSDLSFFIVQPFPYNLPTFK